MDGTASVFLAGSRGHHWEVGHPREPGGLEAKAPLGLAVTTLLRGKQTSLPGMGREGATQQLSRQGGGRVSPGHLVFSPKVWELLEGRLVAEGKGNDLG